MEYLKQISGRILYVIIGAIILSIFIVGPVTKAYEFDLAYKNPAKYIKTIIDKYHKQIETTATYKKIAEAKKTDLTVTGNAKIEKKPDGTEVVTGDKIERKDESAKTETTAATSKTETTDKEKDKKIETSKPVLPTGGSWAYRGGLNADLNAAIGGAGFYINDNLKINVDYVLDLKASALKTGGIFFTVEIRP